jgi:hypothetical protein
LSATTYGGFHLGLKATQLVFGIRTLTLPRLALQKIMSNIQGCHDRDTIRANHFPVVAYFAHFSIQEPG